MAERADADQIRAELSARAKSLDLGSRQWWMDYAFHVTDVQNAAGILAEGRLYCRKQATGRHLMKVENADVGIIKKSAERTDTLARLYFRPRNPFHFDTEGCRPIARRHSSGAHTAVPVFFLFDLAKLLTQQGTEYTNGWGASDSVQLRGDANGLRSMNWRDIYSLGSMGTDPARKGDLKFYRMAEVVMRDHLTLDHLLGVICRTAPERDTLLTILPEEIRDRWRKHVRISTRPDLFELHWTYLRSVQWVGEHIVFSFSASLTPGPFEVELLLTDVTTGRPLSPIKVQRTFSPPNLALRVKAAQFEKLYAEVRLDGSLVYAGTLDSKTLLTDSG